MNFEHKGSELVIIMKKLCLCVIFFQMETKSYFSSFEYCKLRWSLAGFNIGKIFDSHVSTSIFTPTQFQQSSRGKKYMNGVTMVSDIHRCWILLHSLGHPWDIFWYSTSLEVKSPFESNMIVWLVALWFHRAILANHVVCCLKHCSVKHSFGSLISHGWCMACKWIWWHWVADNETYSGDRKSVVIWCLYDMFCLCVDWFACNCSSCLNIFLLNTSVNFYM